MGKPEDTNGGNQKIPMVKTKRYQWSKPEDINEETRRYQWGNQKIQMVEIRRYKWWKPEDANGFICQGVIFKS
jgi:hypothetical protein